MSLCSPERVEFCTWEREAAPPPTPSIPLTAHRVLILRLVLKTFAPSLTYTLSRSSLSALIHQTLNNFLPPLNSHVCISPLYWFGKIPIFQKAARACCTPQPVRPIPAPTTPHVIFIKCVKFDTPKRFSPLLIHRVSVTNSLSTFEGHQGHRTRTRNPCKHFWNFIDCFIART